jgi:hypothetical protein
LLFSTNANEEFTAEELNSAIQSFRNLAIYADKEIDYASLRGLLTTFAHMTFRNNYVRAESASKSFGELLGNPSNPGFRKMFERVLADGQWEAAAAHAFSKFHSVSPARKPAKPWAVLVAGLNGEP